MRRKNRALFPHCLGRGAPPPIPAKPTEPPLPQRAQPSCILALSPPSAWKEETAREMAPRPVDTSFPKRQSDMGRGKPGRRPPETSFLLTDATHGRRSVHSLRVRKQRHRPPSGPSICAIKTPLPRRHRKGAIYLVRICKYKYPSARFFRNYVPRKKNALLFEFAFSRENLPHLLYVLTKSTRGLTLAVPSKFPNFAFSYFSL